MRADMSVGMTSAELAELQDRLLARGATVAVAESLTGGLVTAALTATPGGSKIVRGGLVVYATDLKATLAGVDPNLLEDRGPVDPDVALALARGVRTRLSATYGIGVTGVAGPEPQDGKPVGLVYAALAGPGDADTRWRELRADGDRAAVRSAAVGLCLRMLSEDSSRVL
jgi:nicotinamide-nucleotide amidase